VDQRQLTDAGSPEKQRYNGGSFVLSALMTCLLVIVFIVARSWWVSRGRRWKQGKAGVRPNCLDIRRWPRQFLLTRGRTYSDVKVTATVTALFMLCP